MRPVCCGLLAGWDRLHCQRRGHQSAAVADCSQAGIGYTWGRKAKRSSDVADCSQAGIGYTRRACWCWKTEVADCSQAGVGYTSSLIACCLASVADCSQAGVGYTGVAVHHLGVDVADCSQAGVGYTKPGHEIHRRALRIARRLGSVTLSSSCIAAASRCCGLLAGWGRLHSAHSYHLLRINVADCSQAGVGYTSRAGPGLRRRLRIARRLGSVTLGPTL